MGLNLEWVVDAEPWRAVAHLLGLTLKAFFDGDWCVISPRDAESATLKTAEPRTLAAAQEAAEAAAARLLAEDAGVRALMGLADLRERAESAEECSAQYLREWNAIVAAAGSRTHGAAVGHVAAMRARVAELEASLRWIPVTEGLPAEGVDVLVSRVRPDGSRYMCTRKWQPARPSWVPYPEPTPLGVWVGGGWPSVGGGDHWRPLDAGPVAATSADSANLAATAEEGTCAECRKALGMEDL